MDTEKPILKLDKTTFVGRWERLMGTKLYFEEKEGGKVRLMGKGKYKLVFSHIIPVPKNLKTEMVDWSKFLPQEKTSETTETKETNEIK